MTKDVIAYRYAQALFMIGKEEGTQKLEAYSKTLSIFEQMLTECQMLNYLFYTPVINPLEKQNVLLQLFKKYTIDLNIQYFLLLLAEKNRLSLFSKISSCFKSLMNKIKNLTEAQVTTAIELNTKKQVELTEFLEKKINKQLQVIFKVEPNILGGLVLQINDKVLDISIRSQLTSLKDNIKRGK